MTSPALQETRNQPSMFVRAKSTPTRKKWPRFAIRPHEIFSRCRTRSRSRWTSTNGAIQPSFNSTTSSTRGRRRRRFWFRPFTTTTDSPTSGLQPVRSPRYTRSRTRSRTLLTSTLRAGSTSFPRSSTVDIWWWERSGQPSTEMATEPPRRSPMEQVIKDKAPKPAGLVPKNLQAFILVGLALLMVVIMAVTGRRHPVPPTTTAPPLLPSLVPVNSQRVTDFQKNIEQTQRESAAQVEAALLQQQRQLASP